MSTAALKVREQVLEADEIVLDTVGVVDGGDPLDELDAMFEALEAETTAVSGELVIETVSEDDMIQAGADASLADVRAEALAEMDEMSTPVAEGSALATGAAPTGKKAPPVTKRISSLGMKKSEALTKALGAKLNDYLTLSVEDVGLDPAALQVKIDAKLAEIDALPIKIQEKVVNFYAHLSNGATLSNYTKMAIDILVKDREISSKTLRDAYVARPYSLGTANSQCTQLMKLMTVLELADKAAGKLVANPNSSLLPMFEV